MAALPTVTLANHTSILTGASRPPRHPQQRVVRPRTRRADHHQLARPRGRRRWSTSPPASSRSTTRCTAHGRTRSPRRSTSRATSAPTTRPSTSSAAARCRRSRDARRPAAHDRALRAPVEGLLSGRRSSTTWASSQARGIWRGHYRDVELPDAPVHVGATSRSPTRRSTRVGRTRRSRRRRCATATPALGDGARRRSSSAACSTTRAFVLVADHGMEENDPRCRATGTSPLREAGVQFRDEGYSFLYLGEQFERELQTTPAS